MTTNNFSIGGSSRPYYGGVAPLILPIILIFILFMAAATMAVVGMGEGEITAASPPLPPCFTPEGELCIAKTMIHDDEILTEFYTLEGEKIGEVNLLKVTIKDAPEFGYAGRGGGWIGQVSIERSFMGNGYGRMVWQHGDAILRTTFPGEARALYDTAGWGRTLMADIPAERVLWTNNANLWVYIP